MSEINPLDSRINDLMVDDSIVNDSIVNDLLVNDLLAVFGTVRMSRDRVFQANSPLMAFRASNRLSLGEITTDPFRFNPHSRIGALLLASARDDAPAGIQRQVWRMAIGQAATVLRAREDALEQERLAIELGQRLALRTTELANANRQLAILKAELAAEISATTRLHEFTTRLRAIVELPAVLDEVLTATIEIQQADFGNVQLYNSQSHTLEIVAHRGFNAEFPEYFAVVDHSSSACGRALQSRSRIIIEDVDTDLEFAPHRHIALSSGFRAVQSTPLFNRGGELLGMISTHFKRPHRPSERELRLTDLYARQAAAIIERKRAEDERATLVTLVDRLTHVTRLMSMGELTTSIAHEVNQPLAGVISNCNACIRWLNREVPDLQEARACIENIIRDAARAGDVVRSIRDFTRKAPTRKGALDINRVIHEVISMLSEQLRDRRVETTLILPDGTLCVLADHIQLQQVLINLVVNAVEALHPVTHRPRRLWIRSRRDVENRITVCVEDEGIGISEQSMTHLFDPFFTTKPDGMGLGLSISRDIIQAHGGELNAARNHLYGLTMTFTLPAHGQMP